MGKRVTSDRPSLIYGAAEKVSFELFVIRHDESAPRAAGSVISHSQRVNED
jgi:hypothetical protein